MNARKEPVKSQKYGYWWLAVIIVLVAQLMVHAWIRTESTQTIVDISKTQTILREKQSRTNTLTLERDHLKSDARITAIAKANLGLIQDIFNRTVYLEGKIR